MIKTEHIAFTDSGLTIYLEITDNGVTFRAQGNKNQFYISEGSDSVFFHGKIDVAATQELSDLFAIAFDCSN